MHVFTRAVICLTLNRDQLHETWLTNVFSHYLHFSLHYTLKGILNKC